MCPAESKRLPFAGVGRFARLGVPGLAAALCLTAVPATGQEARPSVCTIVSSDEGGGVIVSCPDGPPEAQQQAIVHTMPCPLRVGDLVLVMPGPDQPVVISNQSTDPTWCIGYYRVAVEGKCPEDMKACRIRDAEPVYCDLCGWIETYDCESNLIRKSDGSCALCGGRELPGVVIGPDSPGKGVPWERVRGRRYVDRCGVMPFRERRDENGKVVKEDRKVDLPSWAPKALAAWDAYSTGDAVGYEAQQAAAESQGLRFDQYLSSLGEVLTIGYPIAFLKNELEKIDRTIATTRNARRRERSERDREAWLEWSTPERLELLAENPDALASLTAYVGAQDGFDPATLEALPPEQRARLEALMNVPPPPELQGEPSPYGPTAENAAYLWEHWDELELLYTSLRLTATARRSW